MTNFREMAPKWLSEKISNFQNINIVYIALEDVIQRFRICNYLNISRFYEHFNDLPKYITIHKIAKFKYFAKVITCSKPPDHVPQSYKDIIWSYFKSLEFFWTAISEPFRENCS